MLLNNTFSNYIPTALHLVKGYFSRATVLQLILAELKCNWYAARLDYTSYLKSQKTRK